MSCPGEPVNFEFSSANATTAAAITLRDEGGTTTRTLASNERFILQAYTGHVDSDAGIVQMFNDVDGDGNVDANEIMAVMIYGSSSGSDLQQATSRGFTPKVKAAMAGNVVLAGRGVIVKG